MELGEVGEVGVGEAVLLQVLDDLLLLLIHFDVLLIHVNSLLSASCTPLTVERIARQ